MEKDFCGWHSKESYLNNIQKVPFFREREIWFCHLGANIGHEQDGVGCDFLRPVLVLRKFNQSVFWAIPLTRAVNEDEYHLRFFSVSGEESFAILSQIRLMDARRLNHQAGDMDEPDFLILKQKLKALLP